MDKKANTRVGKNPLVTARNVIVALLLAIVLVQGFLSTTLVQLIVSGVALFLVLTLGMLILWRAREEAEERKEVAELATSLAGANMRLERFDKMKSEFVSIASHQLRSPLTSIRGYTSMLLEGSYGKLSQKAREALQKIAESSRFMALSVEDYLNVSRIESGNMKYSYSEVDVKKLVSEIVDELRPVALKRGLLLTVRSKLESYGIVKADVGKLKQIVQNLIDNSMKYTTRGSIKILLRDDVKKKKLYIEIVDTGIGMSNETLQAVFEKFERAQNANDVNVTGTGLGLYLARVMARAMKGDVEASSEGEGKGSVFTIEFPLLNK